MFAKLENTYCILTPLFSFISSTIQKIKTWKKSKRFTSELKRQGNGRFTSGPEQLKPKKMRKYKIYNTGYSKFTPPDS